MKRIILISCASKKQCHPAKAKDMYISSLFRLNLKYAQKLKPDKIFILSAKHELLDLEREIECYNVTLNEMDTTQRKKWADNVIKQLAKQADLENDQFIILAGQKYREYLCPRLANYEVPLKGLSIGKQLQYLKKECDEPTLP